MARRTNEQRYMSGYLLCLVVVIATAQGCAASDIPQAQAAKQQLASALGVSPSQIPIKPSLQKKDLPKTRPVQTWPFRNFSSAVSAPVPTTSANGVTYSEVVHAPLANLTADLMVWWFNQNLEVEIPYFNGKRYSLYLMWHPRDHCHQKIVDNDKTLWELQEFFMASKNFTQKNSAGFRSINESQINLELNVKYLNTSGISLAFMIGAWELTSLTHTWQNIPGGGLRLHSQFWIGNPNLAPAVNKAVNAGFGRGLKPTVVASKWQYHCVEEMGNLQVVLPYAYDTLTKNK